MEELKIKKEKVLEAASKCPVAKETLTTLFPEAFEKEKAERLEFKKFYLTDDGDKIILGYDTKYTKWGLLCIDKKNGHVKLWGYIATDKDPEIACIEVDKRGKLIKED